VGGQGLQILEGRFAIRNVFHRFLSHNAI
jgi:hypothetical protein